jgi:hypothetical protein
MPQFMRSRLESGLAAIRDNLLRPLGPGRTRTYAGPVRHGDGTEHGLWTPSAARQKVNCYNGMRLAERGCSQNALDRSP